MKGELTPEDQLRVLTLIWGENGEDGWVFLPWIPGGGRDIKHRRESYKESKAFKWPEGKDEILDHLKARKNDDLYFTPNVFIGELRRVEYMGEERTLYADLDEIDPRTLDQSIMPSIAWESSPGRFQAVWLLNGMVIGASEPGGLNQRMTYHTRADRSGWDTTQLLRVPGRPNFKPQYREKNSGQSVPGELLWARRAKHDTESLEQLLPAIEHQHIVKEVADAEVDSVDRAAVWNRVRMKCSHTVRTYMALKSRDYDPDQHDRSSILWQIERDLADAGCTVPEIVAIVRDSMWNKYSDRPRGGLSQLEAEANKAIHETMQSGTEVALESDDIGLPEDLNWFSEAMTKPIARPSWLVRGLWTRSTCGFISGAPKSFKSWFALDMAISVSLGKPFLNDQQFSTRQGKVLYLQEEDPEVLVRDRAEKIIEGKSPDRHWHAPMSLVSDYAWGDVRSVSDAASGVQWDAVNPVEGLALQIRTGFVVSDPSWQDWLDRMCEKYEFDLVVIDTLGQTLGDIDPDKSSPMNLYILKPLKTLSEKHSCAVAIVHHNRKPNDSGKSRSGQQMLGSVAMHAWAESAIYVQSNEEIKPGLKEVKVDRESKYAAEPKFRVRIPQMTETVKGNQEDNERQMWNPEILLHWGEEEPKNDTQMELEREEKAAPRKGPGFPLYDKIIAKHPGGKALMFAEIRDIYYAGTNHTSKNDKFVQAQLDRAVDNKNCPVQELEDGTWEFTK